MNLELLSKVILCFEWCCILVIGKKTFIYSPGSPCLIACKLYTYVFNFNPLAPVNPVVSGPFAILHVKVRQDVLRSFYPRFSLFMMEKYLDWLSLVCIYAKKLWCKKRICTLRITELETWQEWTTHLRVWWGGDGNDK